MGFWVDSIGKLRNIAFFYKYDIFFLLESFLSMIYATCLIIMFILSPTTITFSRFPSKHLGRIIYGLCFSWVNVSSLRFMWTTDSNVKAKNKMKEIYFTKLLKIFSHLFRLRNREHIHFKQCLCWETFFKLILVVHESSYPIVTRISGRRTLVQQLLWDIVFWITVTEVKAIVKHCVAGKEFKSSIVSKQIITQS